MSLYKQNEATRPFNIVLPMSIRMNPNSIGVEVQAPSFFFLPPTTDQSDDDSWTGLAYDSWTGLAHGLDAAIANPWSIITCLRIITLHLLAVSFKGLLAL